MAIIIILFCLGLALGSFLHVIASRYDARRFILNRGTLGGRSRCVGCNKTLAWYELVPVLSFLGQRGRCRACAMKIGWSHVWVELLSGAIVAAVPFILSNSGIASGGHFLSLTILWTTALLLLVLASLIDMRLYIIPDEITLALAAIGLAATAAGSGSLLGNGAALLGLQASPWLNHLVAAAGAALFFGMLIVLTRGRGMGMGDVKLAFALGLLFGWPDILLLVMLAFVIGAAVGVTLIARGAKKLKSALPFGPFLGTAAAIVFFFGQPMLEGYLRLLYP